jgi:diaminopimelate epimerase
MIRFTKMHGLGNDYVHIDCFSEGLDGINVPQLARAISDRHRGVGSDGLILMCPPEPTAAADVRMEMYNADGSRGEMCGNGIRCVAKYAVEHGLAAGGSGLSRTLRIQTDRGVLAVTALMVGNRVGRVRVDMGSPILTPSEIPVLLGGDRCVKAALSAADGSYEMTCVSMGNPHAVVFVASVHDVDLARIGPEVEHHPLFPSRVNLHVAMAHSHQAVAMRSWERGSGETNACGTGACAVVVAGVLEGRLDRSVTVHLPGGCLDVEWPDAAGEPPGPVFMTGPAEEVFSGDWPT